VAACRHPHLARISQEQTSWPPPCPWA
jgi:hypothetical protein